MFSEGVREYRHASRNSSQLAAWSMRRLARYGAVPDFQPGGPQGVGPVMLRVLVEHRAVPGELQGHRRPRPRPLTANVSRTTRIDSQPSR